MWTNRKRGHTLLLSANRSWAVAIVFATFFCAGCDGDGASSGGAGGDGGTTSQGGGSTTSQGGAGGGTAGAGGTAGGGAGSTTTGSTSTNSGDPLAQVRKLCIDKINSLRATKGLSAYNQWTAAETCADGQATSDESANSPHGAFQQCGESAQNECLGAGQSGIESCLESMWNEKNQNGCSGCDACADGYNPNCPNCDFFGDKTGNVCGHYVNMSAKYFSMAACGFSDLGGWNTIDFK